AAMNEIPAAQDVSLESLAAQLADDFTARLERGERPAIEEYIQRHPQHAGVIRNLFTSLEFMRLTAPASSGMGAPSSRDIEPGAPLGDYRLIREIGRGGMGIVYEAEQLSLARRVALKVLPFAAALDARQLQRFKNEAQAAAHLHHTNIVPVYGVGCARGVHYYAMQYIEGQTLAALIQELRENVEGRMTNDERMTNDQCQRTKESADGQTKCSHSTLGLLSSLGIHHSSFFQTVAQ